MYTDKEFIAKKIKMYRKYAGLTQSELAEKIGISDKHVCRIENAVFTPSLETFLKIVKVLNIDLDEFGININKPQNSIRDEFIKFLYSISDDEIAFYYNMVNQLKNNLQLIKKK